MGTPIATPVATHVGTPIATPVGTSLFSSHLPDNEVCRTEIVGLMR